ncbi:MAG: CvpA family protein [Spirochaetaceae bacterium]|jgi:membrane protein required for colicin V production|nr:CvpA family protein [Spirochaetaceae bacterium]
MNEAALLAPVDIILIALILILVIRCTLRGFIEEFMSVAALVLGILGAVFFHQKGGAFIRREYLQNLEIIPEVLAFVILFIIPFTAVKILEYIVKDIVTRVNLGGFDRLLGSIFGLVEGITLAALVLLLIEIQPLFDRDLLLANSFFARHLLPLIGKVRILLPGGSA